jgi:hypothetical protein
MKSNHIFSSSNIGPAFTTVVMSILMAACGVDEPPIPSQKNSEKDAKSARYSEQSTVAVDNSPARISLVEVNASAADLSPIAEIDYKNSDFITALRCSAAFPLRGPAGQVIRSSTGQISLSNPLELRAVWEQALAATTSCRLLGDKIVRASFSDPLAESGTYFYLFNPCRESLSDESQQTKMSCSFLLAATENIKVINSLNEKTRGIAHLISTKESQLASIALRFRQQMLLQLDAQKTCENNEALDEAQRAKWRAISSVLLSGVAGALGGAIAGPQGALTAAQKTLDYIINKSSRTPKDKPSTCPTLSDLESQTQSLAAEIDSLAKEISQLQKELADSTGSGAPQK